MNLCLLVLLEKDTYFYRRTYSFPSDTHFSSHTRFGSSTVSVVFCGRSVLIAIEYCDRRSIFVRHIMNIVTTDLDCIKFLTTRPQNSVEKGTSIQNVLGRCCWARHSWNLFPHGIGDCSFVWRR